MPAEETLPAIPHLGAVVNPIDWGDYMTDEQAVREFAEFRDLVFQMRGLQQTNGLLSPAGLSLPLLRRLADGLKFTDAEREHLGRCVSSTKARGGSVGSLDLAVSERLVRENSERMDKLKATLAPTGDEAKRAAVLSAAREFR